MDGGRSEAGAAVSAIEELNEGGERLLGRCFQGQGRDAPGLGRGARIDDDHRVT